jgi:predicted DsbA family dithiol-disulfide isomerase
VDVTVLSVPECPNAPLLEERLAIATAGMAGVRVTRRVIHDEQEAAAVGMRGSPTLLIDGVDPFAAAGEPASVSCRLYRQADGSVAGAPSADALRRALADCAQPGGNGGG